ncbi:Flp family type IVb pilin [Nocardioides sp. GXZ039]|uniref:Flp family type IVb pilin n=1 Tax=Nocardioides sp. GXZ039 TaxID=3136018 RepID=UPI0030F3AD31
MSSQPTLQFLMIMLRAHRARLHNEERGATAVEWVVITAILVAIALAVGGVLLKVIKGKADGIDLDTDNI